MRRKRRGVKRIIISWCILLIIVGGGFLYISEKQIQPMLKSVIINAGQSFATDAVNEAVAQILGDGAYSPEDMITVEYDTENNVRSITSDYIKMNMIKSDVSLLAQDIISQNTDIPVTVPLGLLSGFDLLKNTGPDITLHTTITGGITTEFKNSFTSAGVNQTLYTVEAVITGDISVFSSGVEADTKITTSIIIAQTMIAGKIPDIILNTDF